MTDREADIRKGTAVVTGAGRGLGRELVLGLLAEGMQVAGLSRPGAALDALTAELSDQPFIALPTDVADPDQVVRAFARLRETAPPVSVLINNAAVYPRRDFLEESPASFMESVNINLGGSLYCSMEALKDMVAQGHGHIINVITFANEAPIPLAAAYSVSKGAQRYLGRAMAADIRDRFPDILINDWVPGALATEMGIPDGIAPEVSARWGVRLALWHDRSLQGVVFDRDTEMLRPVSRKRRLVNRLMGKRETPRRLG